MNKEKQKIEAKEKEKEKITWASDPTFWPNSDLLMCGP
jgi:hypothetical protein